MLHIFLVCKFIVYSPKVLTVHVKARWFVIVTGRLRETWSSHTSVAFRHLSALYHLRSPRVTLNPATPPCRTHPKPSSLPPIPYTLTTHTTHPHLCYPHTHTNSPIPPTLTSASHARHPNPCHSHQNVLTPATHTLVLVSLKMNSDREQSVMGVELNKQEKINTKQFTVTNKY